MVWCALLYAATGSWLSWRVGRPLIPLNAERYAREADLRFALVRVNEHADGVALYGGEADEKQHLGRDLDRVLAVMRRLVTGLTRLTWITAGYGWLAIVAPILVASPGFFGGDLTLGGLMVAAGALHPGAAIAALVRRQFQHHRRLAGDAAPRRLVPTRVGRYGQAWR